MDAPTLNPPSFDLIAEPGAPSLLGPEELLNYEPIGARVLVELIKQTDREGRPNKQALLLPGATTQDQGHGYIVREIGPGGYHLGAESHVEVRVGDQVILDKGIKPVPSNVLPDNWGIVFAHEIAMVVTRKETGGFV